MFSTILISYTDILLRYIYICIFLLRLSSSLHEFFWLPGASFASVCEVPTEPSATLKSLHSNAPKKKKKGRRKIIPESNVTQILGSFISDITRAKQPSMNTSSPTLTRRKCSKCNSELWIWVWNSMSKWISFIWLHSIWNPGPEPGWQSYRAQRVKLISLRCELAISQIVRAWGVFIQMPPLQPDTLYSSAVLVFIFFYIVFLGLRKNESKSHRLFFG